MVIAAPATCLARMSLALLRSCLGLPALLVLASANAVAANQHALVQVEPDEGCLSSQSLEGEVKRRLSGTQIPKDIAFLVRSQGSLELQVMRAGKLASQRRFEPGPASCEAVRALLSFAIALAIKAARTDTLDHPRQDERRLEHTPHTGRWSLAAAGLASYRTIHGLTPGLLLSLGRRFHETFELRISGHGALRRQLSLPNHAGSFHAALLALHAEGCARTSFAGPVQGGVCVGLLGGALYAAGAQVDEASSSLVPYLAVSASLEIELELSKHWSLMLKAWPTYLTHEVSVGVVDQLGAPTAQRALPRLAVAVGLGPAFFF